MVFNMNLQEVFDKLKPYLIGIRYVEGMTLVDAILKPKWVIPASQYIKTGKNEQTNPEFNYIMLYSELPSITLDNLLDYLSLIINVNLEKEAKLELLKAKVEELKMVFQNNQLDKLKQLTFSFKEVGAEEDIDLEISEINDEIIYNNYSEPKPEVVQTYVEPVYPDGNIPTEASIAMPMNQDDAVVTSQKFSASDIDNYGTEYENTEGLSEEELEIIEEEKRGARNLAIIKAKRKVAS